MPWITRHREIWRLVKFFDLTYERNIPAIFSTFLLACASFLLGKIAYKKYRIKDHFSLHWSILSFIFLFLALDEFQEIHEGLDDFIKTTINSETLFSRNWVYSGTIIIILFLFFYWKFFTHLPRVNKARRIIIWGNLCWQRFRFRDYRQRICRDLWFARISLFIDNNHRRNFGNGWYHHLYLYTYGLS